MPKKKGDLYQKKCQWCNHGSSWHRPPMKKNGYRRPCYATYCHCANFVFKEE